MTIIEMVAIQMDTRRDSEKNARVMPPSEAPLLSGLAGLMDSEQISETINRMIMIAR